MAPLISELVTKLETEIVFVVSGSEIISQSRAADAFMSRFPHFELPGCSSGISVLKTAAGAELPFQVTTAPVPDSGEILVTVKPTESYDELVEKVQVVDYTLQTLSQGVAFRGNDASLTYVTDRFSEMCGVPVDRFISDGIHALLRSAFIDDQPSLITALEGDSSVIIRFHVDDLYQPVRVITNSKSIILQEIVFDVKEPTTNASYMLTALMGSVFDASFYVDTHFRIIDDSPKIAAFFSSDRRSVNGLLLESFIPTVLERERFRSTLVEAATAVSTTQLDAVGPGPTVRTTMQLAGDSRAEVAVFATSTFLHLTPVVDEDSVRSNLPPAGDCPVLVVGKAAAQSAEKFLIGIKFVRTEIDLSAPQIADKVADERAESVSIRSRESTSQLGQVPEESECSESESVGSSTLAGSAFRVSKMLLSHALQRALTRDVIAAVSTIEALTVTDEDWLVPLYEVCDKDVVEDELVRCLPSGLQGELVSATKEGNFSAAGSLLSRSLIGDLNIIQQGDLQTLCQDEDLIHCAFRYFVSLAPRAGSTAFALLADIENAVIRIAPLLGQAGVEVASFGFAMALISAAYRHPEYAGKHMAWLRDAFTNTLKLKESKQLDMAHRLPSMYYVCALWGCLMHKLRRDEEAVAVLANLFDDTVSFCHRHPESFGVRKLQAVCAYNLAIQALSRDDVHIAFTWTHKLQTVLAASHVQFPQRCHDLVKWAESTQARIQQDKNSFQSSRGS